MLQTTKLHEVRMLLFVKDGLHRAGKNIKMKKMVSGWLRLQCG